MKKRLWLVIIAIVVVVGAIWLRHDTAGSPAKRQATQSAQKRTPETKPTAPSLNKQQHSLTNPTSIWVIVNKHRPLQPANYVPADLVLPAVAQRVPGTAEMKMRKPAADALKSMLTAAKQAGLPMMISTAYRSYRYQTVLYNGYVKSQGKAVADTQSARPGYSEHQTGLAVDLRATSNKCPIEDCFGKMPEGKWLATNGYKYGFIVRYPKGKEQVTGYIYEPWHMRYVGIPLATEMHRTGVTTLEEFFGLGNAPTYR